MSLVHSGVAFRAKADEPLACQAIEILVALGCLDARVLEPDEEVPAEAWVLFVHDAPAANFSGRFLCTDHGKFEKYGIVEPPEVVAAARRIAISTKRLRAGQATFSGGELEGFTSALQNLCGYSKEVSPDEKKKRKKAREAGRTRRRLDAIGGH